MTRFGKFLTGAGVLAMVIVVVAGVWIWLQFFRDDAPPPVSIDSAVTSLSESQAATTSVPAATATADDAPATTEPEATEELEATATTETGVSETPAAESTAESAAQPTAEAESVSASWSVIATGDSFVGYRVGEELATIGTAEGVGRTSNVAGLLSLEGATVTSASFEADLTSLESDDSRRDRALSDQSLETSVYPTASFELTSPIELGELPADGVTFTATATGDLTLHGVTRSVEIPLEAQFSDGLLVVGSLEIQFADYEISPPSAPAVVSVNDFGTLELQFVFSQA